jgi:hypothetical protein
MVIDYVLAAPEKAPEQASERAKNSNLTRECFKKNTVAGHALRQNRVLIQSHHLPVGVWDEPSNDEIRCAPAAGLHLAVPGIVSPGPNRAAGSYPHGHLSGVWCHQKYRQRFADRALPAVAGDSE